LNIAQNLENAAYYFPERSAVVDEDREMDFEQFNREACRVASALVSLGIRPGDHAGLCAPNSWRWLAFYFGVIKAGAVAVTFSHMLSHENLQTSIHNVAHNERSTEKDLGLCFLPLNHVFAQIHIVNATIYKAGGVILQPGFDLEKALEAIVRRRITKFYAVPTIYIRFLLRG